MLLVDKKGGWFGTNTVLVKAFYTKTLHTKGIYSPLSTHPRHSIPQSTLHQRRRVCSECWDDECANHQYRVPIITKSGSNLIPSMKCLVCSRHSITTSRRLVDTPYDILSPSYHSNTAVATPPLRQIHVILQTHSYQRLRLLKMLSWDNKVQSFLVNCVSSLNHKRKREPQPNQDN